ncbi:hypothetical protein VPNG_01009 [Cytospora leucostoma]|uniref:Uncharacterized protein n=1 Tax=Cytospora leucostoma TaxID=1230097 RepID=A0A423XMJ4_9PEZI|nr:hypothetical protein VPNG_01009 [Cytospora leucostoma]
MDPESPHRIMIYEHKICLWNHLRMAQDRNNVPVLPLPLVEEAIDTLNLLFPFSKKSTKSFLRRHGKSFHGLGKCGRATQYDLQEYHYWRKEIGDLAEALSQQPRGRAQFILNKDGTNTLAFWTFWTAVVFGLLGTIGATMGVYSAVYARKAFDIGVLQYQLALAQACSAFDHLKVDIIKLGFGISWESNTTSTAPRSKKSTFWLRISRCKTDKKVSRAVGKRHDKERGIATGIDDHDDDHDDYYVAPYVDLGPEHDYQLSDLPVRARL